MEKPSSKPGCIWTREEAGWSPGQAPPQRGGLCACVCPLGLLDPSAHHLGAELLFWVRPQMCAGRQRGQGTQPCILELPGLGAFPRWPASVS